MEGSTETKHTSKSKPVLELEDVRKSYGTEVKVEALKGVSLAITEGEFVAIIGPSGSGKSTLMHIIGCLLRPTSGKVKIDGIKTSGLSEAELAEIRGKKIGFVFQQFNLLPRITALRNVALPLSFQKAGKKERMERAKKLLEEVGLGHRLEHFPNELSGGQRQRVAIARALVSDPAIVLADELTGNLDTKTGEEIMKIFKELNEKGRTIVMVTHEPHIADWAKRKIQLKDGVILNFNDKLVEREKAKVNA